MLYNPKWEKTETKADPFTLKSLIAWLEKQPEDGTFKYTDIHNCMLCQYFKAQGFSVDSVDPYHVHFEDGTRWEISKGFYQAANNLEDTFGRALKEARAWR